MVEELYEVDGGGSHLLGGARVDHEHHLTAENVSFEHWIRRKLLERKQNPCEIKMICTID